MIIGLASSEVANLTIALAPEYTRERRLTPNNRRTSDNCSKEPKPDPRDIAGG